MAKRGKSTDREREGPPSSSLRRPMRGLGHNLPLETTSFVGRTEELARLGEAITTKPLVTVRGPPGTGKTRLALRVADRRLSEFLGSGGVWFVELSGARTRDDACAAIANVIGAPSSETSDAATRLGHALRARGRTLLVLDNLEQLSDEMAPVIGNWLLRADELHVLVTSRESLRIPQEHVFDLGPLPVPEPEGLSRERALLSSAVELFLARAPGFVLDDETAPGLAALLVELDGLPLAIELSAARLPVLGLAELRSRMQERLDLLTHGPRTRESRQTTLRGALDWSFNLLTPDERRAFAICGAFASAFELDALSHLLERPALDLVQALCEKSLLVAKPDAGRFHAYASIRAYALERLRDLDDAERILTRHAERLANVGSTHVERFELHASEESWHWLASEIDDVLTATERTLENEGASELSLRLLLVSEAVLSRRGPHTLLAKLLDRALGDAAFENAPSGLEARILRARALHEKNRGNAAASLEFLERAERAAESAGDQSLAVQLLTDTGSVEQSQGRLDHARDAFERARARLSGLADPRVRGRLLAAMGLLHHSQGQLDHAHTAYDEAMRLARVARDPWTEANVEKDIGSLRLQQGRLDEAREHYARALSFEERLGIPTFGALIEGNLAILEQERGDLSEARACFENALRTFRHTGARLLEGHVLGYLACLDLECEAYAEASVRFAAAIEVLQEVGDVRNEGLFWAGRGAAEAIADREKAAEESFDRAERLLNDVGDPGLFLALALHRAQLALSRARKAEPIPASELRAEVAKLARDAREDTNVSDDARFALRILERQLARASLVWDDSADELVLTSGEAVSFAARAQLKKLVVAFVERRLAAPGAPLTEQDLLDACWPGEKMSATAAQNRVKVALSTLRKMGMREVLLHHENGWMLDPGLPLFRK